MLGQGPVGCDVLDGPAGRDQPVGDQAPVTMPPQSLGAHDRGRGGGRVLGEVLECGGEGVGQRVIGVGAEGVVLPAGVGRVRLWPAPAAERRVVPVRDPAWRQLGGERVLVELRMAARTRVGADVRQQARVMGVQEGDEGVERMRRVADGEDAAPPATIVGGAAGTRTQLPIPERSAAR